MQIPYEQGKLFYKLYASLLGFVSRERKVLREKFSTTKEYVALPIEKRHKVRNALYDDLTAIDRYVAANPDRLDADELAIVESWQNAVCGDFFIYKYLKNHAIFLHLGKKDGSDMKAYGVLALADPFDLMIDQPLPVFCRTVLLPLGDRIIYDGLMVCYPVLIGSNIKQSLKEDFDRAKKRFGVITSLLEPIKGKVNATPSKKKMKTAKPAKKAAKKTVKKAAKKASAPSKRRKA